MANKTETARHEIYRGTEDLYPVPFSLIPGFGDQVPKTQIFDKQTHNWGEGTAKSRNEADRRAWDDLESKNRSK